ncbi:MAG: LytTR family transcriptional regulator, partial [Rhabdaerophilum sp.]
SPQREAAFDTALAAGSNASIVWISDGIRQGEDAGSVERFIAAAGARLDIIAMQPSSVLALSGLTQNAEGLEAVIRRPVATGQARQGLIRAYDDKGRLLGDTTFALTGDSREARARLALPIELVNDITRLEIADEKHAGAV